MESERKKIEISAEPEEIEFPGRSLFYCKQRFKKITGKSPGEYRKG
jgi:hypothetical protein